MEMNAESPSRNSSDCERPVPSQGQVAGNTTHLGPQDTPMHQQDLVLEASFSGRAWCRVSDWVPAIEVEWLSVFRTRYFSKPQAKATWHLPASEGKAKCSALSECQTASHAPSLRPRTWPSTCILVDFGWALVPILLAFRTWGWINSDLLFSVQSSWSLFWPRWAWIIPLPHCNGSVRTYRFQPKGAGLGWIKKKRNYMFRWWEMGRIYWWLPRAAWYVIFSLAMDQVIPSYKQKWGHSCCKIIPPKQ